MEPVNTDFYRSGFQNSQNLFLNTFRNYFRYWKLIVVFSILSLALGLSYLFIRNPIYESTAAILIKDENRGIEDSKMIQSLDPLSSKKIIENEMEILRSKALLSEVVSDLKLYAPIYKRGRFLFTSAYSSSPISIEAADPTRLVEVKRVKFVVVKDSNKILIDSVYYDMNTWQQTPWGKLKFAYSHNQFSEAGDIFYFSLINPKRVVRDLEHRLNVSSAGKLSSVIDISIKEEDRLQAEDVLNKLLFVYDKADIDDKNGLAINTLKFLDERLRIVSEDLDTIEHKLQKYKSDKGAINLSSQGQLYLQSVSDNDQKVSNIDIDMSMLDEIVTYLKSENNTGSMIPSSIGVKDPVLNNLLTQLYQLQLEREKLSSTTGANNPQLVAIQSQLVKLKSNILDNVVNQKKALEISKANISNTNNFYGHLLKDLPQQERDIVEISRQKNIKTDIYTFLLQKKEEATISLSSTVSDTRIVDKADSSLEPVNFPGWLILGISLFCGLTFTIGLITVRHVFGNKIVYFRDRELLSNIPVIGEIHYEKRRKKDLNRHPKESIVSEGFRMLRTSINSLQKRRSCRKILVTSTISGEGKSFIALNLAKCLSNGGKKVVLVEFDLTHPSLTKRFDMQVGVGLTDYLASKVGVEKLASRVSEDSNLYLIAAGDTHPNPADLISESKTEALFNYLTEKYDYVIVDTAPVGLASEGYTLSTYCDLTLYVVRHMFTPKDVIQRLIKNSKVSELENIALVFNGVQSNSYLGNVYGYEYSYAKKY